MSSSTSSTRSTRSALSFLNSIKKPTITTLEALGTKIKDEKLPSPKAKKPVAVLKFSHNDTLKLYSIVSALLNGDSSDSIVVGLANGVTMNVNDHLLAIMYSQKDQNSFIFLQLEQSSTVTYYNNNEYRNNDISLDVREWFLDLHNDLFVQTILQPTDAQVQSTLTITVWEFRFVTRYESTLNLPSSYESSKSSSSLEIAQAFQCKTFQNQDVKKSTNQVQFTSDAQNKYGIPYLALDSFVKCLEQSNVNVNKTILSLDFINNEKTMQNECIFSLLSEADTNFTSCTKASYKFGFKFRDAQSFKKSTTFKIDAKQLLQFTQFINGLNGLNGIQGLIGPKDMSTVIVYFTTSFVFVEFRNGIEIRWSVLVAN